MGSKIKFKDGTELDTISVFGSKEVIENAYRDKFEIRFPETVTLEQINNIIATADNLSEITLEECDDSGNVTSSYTYQNFSMVRSVGFNTDSSSGVRYNVLVIAQLSTLEIAQKEQAANIDMLTGCVLEMSEQVYQ